MVPGSTPTGPGPSPAARTIPVRQSWSGSMPTTCTKSTATSTPTTCSSICGAVRTGIRWPIRPVYDLVRGCAARTGIDFDPHWYRHTTATRLLRDGVPIEVVSTVLGHASITTTVQTVWAPDQRGRPPGARGGRLVRRDGRCRGDRHPSRPVLARPGLLGQAHGGGPAGVPGRRARLRPGRPRCSAEVSAGSRAAPGRRGAGACARLTTTGGPRAGRIWRRSSRPPTLAGTSRRRWPAATPRAAAAVSPARGCAPVTPRRGNVPGSRRCSSGWPHARDSAPAGQQACLIGPASCGPRGTSLSATVTARPGRSTAAPAWSSSAAMPRTTRSPGMNASILTACPRSSSWRSSTPCSAAATSGPSRSSPSWSRRSCGSWAAAR